MLLRIDEGLAVVHLTWQSRGEPSWLRAIELRGWHDWPALAPDALDDDEGVLTAASR